MTAWTSFMKSFYTNERNLYKSCASSGTLKRAAKIYKCQKRKEKKTEKKHGKRSKDSFTVVNPMYKKLKFRKTVKKSKK